MRTRQLLLLGLLLALASGSLFGLHLLAFRDPRLVATYLVYDLAFLPLEVLFVTLLLDRLLSAHERRDRQHKMNMLIGAYFSTVGRDLLSELTGLCTRRGELAAAAAVTPEWTGAQIRAASVWARQHTFALSVAPRDLVGLRVQLVRHEEFLLRLLENPILLEQEAFTDLLWATFHFHEELAAREDLNALAAADLSHLGSDAERAYGYLVGQWLAYLDHLRGNYPYLFSFAARTNPLRADPRAELGSA